MEKGYFFFKVFIDMNDIFNVGEVQNIKFSLIVCRTLDGKQCTWEVYINQEM